jgi:alkanesulfonate monooxygenase SsuD/methylene tetrahydromethanopterin reductase-like flavin-dependent oxidoreductase (luciferase family)
MAAMLVGTPEVLRDRLREELAATAIATYMAGFMPALAW